MARMLSADERRLAKMEGNLAAARAIARLKVDETHQIDIFRIIMREPLWLLFQPLAEVLGVFEPGAILINARRTRALQRLTAAHEYGHHVMRHTGSIDDTGTITGIPEQLRKRQDVAAQAFAMAFLIPPTLIYTLYQRLALPSSITPVHAYRLSLCLGVSYEATVYRLIAMELLSDTTGLRLLDVTPKKIKQEIGQNVGPRNSWADLWPVTLETLVEPLHLRPDDELVLQLPETPSTGYQWAIQDADAAVMDIVTSTFQSTLDDAFFGETGVRYIRLRALYPGTCRPRLVLHRTGQAEPHDTHELCITIEPIPQGVLAEIGSIL